MNLKEIGQTLEVVHGIDFDSFLNEIKQMAKTEYEWQQEQIRIHRRVMLRKFNKRKAQKRAYCK